MELQDGFIVGIFNYCDRWCETCGFTSRCQVFATNAEFEAAGDPTLQAVAEAPLLPEEDPEPPPWLTALIEAMNDAVQSHEPRPAPKPLPREHEEIQARARGYGLHVHGWRTAHDGNDGSDPRDPLAVVGWFSHFISSKVYRALRGLADADPADRGDPADHDGSAKIALIGIERSHAAWLDLVAAERVSANTAEPFIADLIWLGEAVERVFPKARHFIRPGFDEPDEVAKLEIEIE